MFDGYTELEQIGHGGLGDVYRATRVSTGGTVAIKVLRDIADESVAWNRTRRELTALVSLGGHAHVIQLIEILEHTPGLVMEYAPGGSVGQLLERRGATLAVGETTLIGCHTAAALAAAHAQGIVHRDVKPQNLLIDAYGQVKLCDFGIASLTRTAEFRTRTSAISMRYASPEDLDDDADVGPPADVYSLGATLMHLGHGAPPTLKERLAPWTPPPTDDPEQAALDEIVAACLRPTPASRPTAGEVLDRLERLDWSLAERCRSLADGLVASGQARPIDRADPRPIDTSAPQPLRAPTDLADPSDAPMTGETLLRTGRRRPEPPRPPARPRRRTAPWLVLLGLGIAAATAGWLLTRGDDDPAASPASTTDVPSESSATTASTVEAAIDTAAIQAVERPDGLISLDDPSLTWPFGPVGGCLVQLADADALAPIRCSKPHDLERFAVGTVPDGDYDAATLNATIDAACSDAFPEQVGDSVEGVQIAQTRPSAASWADGDRDYQCLLGVPDARLVGFAGT